MHQRDTFVRVLALNVAGDFHACSAPSDDHNALRSLDATLIGLEKCHTGMFLVAVNVEFRGISLLRPRGEREVLVRDLLAILQDDFARLNIHDRAMLEQKRTLSRTARLVRVRNEGIVLDVGALDDCGTRKVPGEVEVRVPFDHHHSVPSRERFRETFGQVVAREGAADDDDVLGLRHGTVSQVVEFRGDEQVQAIGNEGECEADEFENENEFGHG